MWSNEKTLERKCFLLDQCTYLTPKFSEVKNRDFAFNIVGYIK